MSDGRAQGLGITGNCDRTAGIPACNVAASAASNDCDSTSDWTAGILPATSRLPRRQPIMIRQGQRFFLGFALTPAGCQRSIATGPQASLRRQTITVRRGWRFSCFALMQAEMPALLSSSGHPNHAFNSIFAIDSRWTSSGPSANRNDRAYIQNSASG